MPFSGQLWYLTEGNGSEARLVRVNDDGTGSTLIVDNGSGAIGSATTSDIGVDTAAGFYFALLSNTNNDHATLVRGSIGGGATNTLVTFASTDIVNTIEVDQINRKIYVGIQNSTGTNGPATGIKVYSYDAAGALTDLLFITTAASDDRANVGSLQLLDPQDFALDRTIGSGGRLFYSERLTSNSVNLFRLDVNTPNDHTAMLSAAAFPVNGSSGFIIDVEVDESNHKVYFTTRGTVTPGNGGYDANDNAVWWVDASADNVTPTRVTLSGLPGGAAYFGGDMTFDQSTRQIYIESEETGASEADDVIYVLQLDASGTTATYIRSISPGLSLVGSNIEGMTFTDLAALTVAGAGTAAAEQGSQVTLLSGAPTITDNDGGYLTGATVQITGGTFTSNESSTADDHLGFGAGKQVSGTISGTSITVSWNAASETLTLSGLDTIAHYQTAMAGLVYWATGDNPTNYGANTSRTITWTITDGTPGVLAGSVNTTTSTVSITAANDAPVNGTVSSATGNENSDIPVTGLQVSDVDANPASATMTVTLSVTKGILTLRTNVASGLTAGNVSGNGTGTVTVTGTINAINATLAASNGLLFHGNTNVAGTDTLTVVTSDGGATGSGGAQSDTDGYTITIIGTNDAPTVGGDGTEVLGATNEDVSPASLTNTVSTLFSGQYADGDGDAFAGVAVVANGSTVGTGQWQYWNGAAWTDIGAASTASAKVLSASTAVRFNPTSDFNGPAPILTVRLIDSSNGAVTSGGTANTTSNGGASVYSSGTVVLSHTVSAVNDAPTVINGSAVSLASVAEDAAPGGGQTISSVFGSGIHFSDAKDAVSGGSSANVFTGVAVTANAASAAQGVYQYFAGGIWHDLPAVSTTTAFILEASTLIRFLPAADYSGTVPSLTLSLIEDSSGAVTTGATADLTTVGGTTQYSAALTLNIVVTPSNDAPVASGSASLTAVNEDTASPAGATVSSLFGSHFTDQDGDTFAGVAITGNATSSQGVWQYDATGGGTWVTINSPTESAAVKLAAGALIRFLPAPNFNGAVPALTAYLIDNSGGAITSGGATLDVSVNGGQTRYSDSSISLTTSITAVNDTPAVPGSAVTVGATEQIAATLLSSLVVSDIDLDARNGGNGDYGGASFTVQRASANAADTFGFASGGLFTVSGGNLQVGGLTFATFTSTGGVLTISFTSSATTATSTLVNDVIEHITYTNTSDAPPASLSLNYALNDGSPGGGQGTGGSASAGGSVLVNITAVNDLPTGGASVTGTAAEDQVLTAVSTIADADGLGTLHYQWQHNVGGGYVNVGADQSTYTLGDGEIGGIVRVTISYLDAGGTVESSTSTATGVIVATNDLPTGGVGITGTATEDQVLTADTSTLSDSDGLGTLHYQWQHNVGAGFVNVGTDQVTYTLGDSDVGATVRVIVSYTDGQGFADTVTSAATAPIANVNDLHTGGVSISGAATETQTLTAVSTLVDADGLGALHYQWQRDTGSGFTNVGSDQSTYALTSADIGGVVRVVTSYTDGHGTAESETSAPTATVIALNGPHTGTVTITGTVAEDQILTAVSTLADPGGLGPLHYQWQRDTGGGFVNVGTDQSTYALGDADVGGTIRVIASYTDGQGVFESETSGATAAVANVNDAATGGVSVTGTATEDQILTAVTSTIADIDGLGTLHYNWQRNTGSGFVATGAADTSTYTLGDADVGATVRVVVSYTDGHGTLESLTSAATGAVTNVNDGPVATNDANSVLQRLTITGSVRANDSDVDNAQASLTVTNVAFNFTHVDQTVVAGGTVVHGGYGDLTIKPDGTYTYVANQEGLIIGQVVTDKFDYVIKDPSGVSATAQLTVTVTGSATGDANANIIISDGLAHTLTGKGGADTLTGNGAADIFAYEAIGDSTVAAFDTITDFTHAQDTLRLTPLITGSTKLTLATDGTNKFLYIDQNGDGTAEGLILSQGLGLEVTDITTGVANFGFTIYGSSGADTLTGGSGNDVIAGYGGADIIRGGVGADILYGGTGADTFIYATGDSTSSKWDLISDFATGQDKLDISAADSGKVTISFSGASTFIYFGNSGNVVQVNGAITVDDLIVSGAVTGVTIFGGASSGTLTGGSGNDTIVGGAGTSTLIGGLGADILYGGGGVDTFLYTSVVHSNQTTYDLIVGFTSGTDKLDISAIDGGKVTLARYNGVTFVYSAPDGGGALQSAIAVQGLTLKSSDLITSGGATQAFNIVGDGANHNIADVLVGGAAGDILYGLDGKDTLTGGGGADFLVGGLGADTFVYASINDSSTIASDLIFDFNRVEGDRLDLVGIDANSGTGANDAFAVVAAFSNVAGQLVIATPDASGYYHVSGDVNGDGVADFVIAVNVAGTLTSADILL
jgi:Ca2+-binding RTX toxin-like protein